ncbi:hypothetical protein HNQ08_002167 [Deinococcus humi]|uniref:Uncharacterized protein n=1 Tax=Deinococcus humi TaxID=662880 RepID=A0A7W8JWQ1_9DEIO|nr:hypothetical protein [Deinococcus humi]GGO24873.1 hypothetical protein GCM10008949_14170 [Deinococcus humi]
MLPKYPTTGKSTFRGPGEAQRESLRYAPRRSGCHPPWRAYLCPHCNLWHATRRPKVSDIIRRQRVRRWKQGKHDQTD